MALGITPTFPSLAYKPTTPAGLRDRQRVGSAIPWGSGETWKEPRGYMSDPSQGGDSQRTKGIAQRLCCPYWGVLAKEEAERRQWQGGGVVLHWEVHRMCPKKDKLSAQGQKGAHGRMRKSPAR